MTEHLDVTALLAAHGRGAQGAFDQAVALVYQELRRIARGQRRRHGSQASGTLDTTAIVHEAYLKLLGTKATEWQNRDHFLAVAATAMRHVAVDYAKGRRRAKRGGGAPHVRVDDVASPAANESMDAATADPGRQVDEILAVHVALQRLEADEPKMVRVVECRYYAGMTEAESATALGVSVSTVQRLWRSAKTRLRTALTSSDTSGPSYGYRTE